VDVEAMTLADGAWDAIDSVLSPEEKKEFYRLFGRYKALLARIEALAQEFEFYDSRGISFSDTILGPREFARRLREVIKG